MNAKPTPPGWWRGEREANVWFLEYKQLYIPKTELTRNRTCQSYRWKQYAKCEDRESLEDIKSSQIRPEDWRIVEYPTR